MENVDRFGRTSEQKQTEKIRWNLISRQRLRVSKPSLSLSQQLRSGSCALSLALGLSARLATVRRAALLALRGRRREIAIRGHIRHAAEQVIRVGRRARSGRLGEAVQRLFDQVNELQQ